MLYVTTREKYDAYTVARTLAGDCGPDGGRYLPYKMPKFSADEIAALKDKSFGQIVAEVLNLFFGAGLTGWDVEFSIGRYPVRVVSMGQKVFVAECWRNLEGSYEKMERLLGARICKTSAVSVKMTSWLRIAIRIALLTALTGELQRQGMTDTVDVAVPDGDFSVPMAVWYARQMGLPVENIICACRDGSEAWNLLYNGQIRTGLSAMPELERLIYGALGIDEAIRCHKSGHYTLPALTLDVLRSGIYPTVVSDDRIQAAIPNVYRTNAYVLETGAAAAYSGLMDYRAKAGETRCALLLEDCSPAENAKAVSATLRITEDKLKELLR